MSAEDPFKSKKETVKNQDRQIPSPEELRQLVKDIGSDELIRRTEEYLITEGPASVQFAIFAFLDGYFPAGTEDKKFSQEEIRSFYDRTGLTPEERTAIRNRVNSPYGKDGAS